MRISRLLKTYFQEFIEVSKGASTIKQKDFFGYLWDKVDFANFKVKDLTALNSLYFKNTIWNLSSDELEINRMFHLSFVKLKEIQSYVDNLLKSST